MNSILSHGAHQVSQSQIAQREFDRSQTLAIAAVTSLRADPANSTHGAFTSVHHSQGLQAKPFYEDHTFKLSRPAHMTDYQADSSAYPFRTQRPGELAPYVAKSSTPVEQPKVKYTSEDEQKWLHERAVASRAASSITPAKSYATPPAPFVSKLGFRSPEPCPPQPKPCTDFGHRDGVSSEFFFGGREKFVSENGTANSQMYYKLARPLGGRIKTHYSTQTTPHGYRFEQYTSRP